MGETDFYKLFGLGRSASAHQIKIAYRELVKRHHPDLFSEAGEKAKATEKLRMINEAYAVLGNPQRRQRYDEEFVQKQRTRKRALDAAAHTKAPHPRRPQDQVRRKTLKTPKLRLRFSKKWARYSLGAAAAILLLIYAGRSVPRLATAYVLIEKLEVSPSRNISPPARAGDGWVRVAEFASVSNCVAAIKEKVRQDEREGSRSVYDEQNGTMAITLYVKTATAQEEQAVADAESSQNSSATRRVRNLECRATQRMEMESWFQRALRGLGWLQ